MKILIVEPNKEPYIRSCSNIDNLLMDIIGNNLKYLKLQKHTYIVYDDKGKNKNLSFNRIIKNDVICGSFVIIGKVNENWISLSSKQIRRFKKKFMLRHYKGLLQFMNQNIKQSSDLLNWNLTGIDRLNKMVVSDRNKSI